MVSPASRRTLNLCCDLLVRRPVLLANNPSSSSSSSSSKFAPEMIKYTFSSSPRSPSTSSSSSSSLSLPSGPSPTPAVSSPTSSSPSIAPPPNSVLENEYEVGDPDLSFFFSELQTTQIGRHLISRNVVSSTMEVALREGVEGAPHGTVVLAKVQTQGRGRGGREWVSEEGNLYFTVLLRPKVIQTVFKVNLAMILACALTARSFGVEDAMIKWPNDIWVRGKKLAGYIVDTSPVEPGRHICLVGVGMNINGDYSKAEDKFLRENATSIASEIKKPVSRYLVLAGICNHFEKLLEKELSELLPEYESMSMLLGKRIVVKPKRREDPEGYEAEAVGLSKEGFLIVKVDGHLKTITGEEVMVRLAEYDKFI